MRRLFPGVVFVVLCVAVLVGAVAPGIAWRLMPPRPLGVIILDKTVPDTTYRGHRAVDLGPQSPQAGPPGFVRSVQCGERLRRVRAADPPGLVGPAAARDPRRQSRGVCRGHLWRQRRRPRGGRCRGPRAAALRRAHCGGHGPARSRGARRGDAHRGVQHCGAADCRLGSRACSTALRLRVVGVDRASIHRPDARCAALDPDRVATAGWTAVGLPRARCGAVASRWARGHAHGR